MVKFWIIIDLIYFIIHAILYHNTKNKINLIFAIGFFLLILAWEILMYAGLR